MNLDILLEQLGEDGVYALLNGLYVQMKDDQKAVAKSLTYSVVASVKTIEETIDNLADMRAMRLRYDELGKALDKYAYPKGKED